MLKKQINYLISLKLSNKLSNKWMYVNYICIN